MLPIFPKAVNALPAPTTEPVVSACEMILTSACYPAAYVQVIPSLKTEFVPTAAIEVARYSISRGDMPPQEYNMIMHYR